MDTLFLDFASNRKAAVLLRGSAVTSEIFVDNKVEEEQILPKIEKMLSDAGLSLRTLSRIAAVTGPGGFMSQRVGLAIANALSWSLHIPIGGVHLSDVWHARCRGDAVWFHATKKELLFIRGFGSYAALWPDAVTISLENARAALKADTPFIGEVLPEQQAVLRSVPASGLRPIADVLPGLVDGLTYGEPPLLPWYGRGA